MSNQLIFTTVTAALSPDTSPACELFWLPPVFVCYFPLSYGHMHFDVP